MAKNVKLKKNLTKEQIEEQVRAGKLTLDEAMKLLNNGIRFEVAEKSGWLSIYFPDRRFPVTMPLANVEELLQETTLERLRTFIDGHRSEFTTLEDRKAQKGKKGSRAAPAEEDE